MNWKLVALVVLVLVCSSVAAFVVMRTQRQPVRTPVQQPVVVPVTEAPIMMMTTAPPATSPPPSTARPDVLLYAPGTPPYYWPGTYAGPVNRYPKAYWPPAPRPIQPGGSWSELMGRDYQDAAAYVMSTYPNMHVAMVRYGAPMPTDTRHDRFVIVYDAWTRKVVGAQIG
jgi:hypothetical protein